MLNFHQDVLENLRHHQVDTRNTPLQKAIKAGNSHDSMIKIQQPKDVFQACEHLFVSNLIPFHNTCIEAFQTLANRFKPGTQLSAEALHTMLAEDLPKLLKHLSDAQKLDIRFILSSAIESPLIFLRQPKPDFPGQFSITIPPEQSPFKQITTFSIELPRKFKPKEIVVVDDPSVEKTKKELLARCSKNPFIALYQNAPNKAAGYIVNENILEPNRISFAYNGQTCSITVLCRGNDFDPLSEAESKRAYRFCLRREHLSQAIEVDKKKVAKLQQLLKLYQADLASSTKVPTISRDQHLKELAQLTSALDGTALNSKKVEAQVAEEQRDPVKLSAPIPKSEPSSTSQFTLPPKMYEIFEALIKHSRKLSWSEVKECFSLLGFSIRPVGGSIYKFQYQDTSALIQEETDEEYSERMSKNLHMPHDKGQDANTPLNPARLKRFRLLLEEANMTLETVVAGKAAKKK
ncbi:MAG: hypothetical protein LLG04_05805 [Parachlamydia sp.]|nr:hypothetical protein [Parachlamydia sp.]